jgi:hypothetical protein
MIKRTLIIVLLIGPASVATAFELLNSFYPSQTLEFQLGDVCDSARFPLTPGTCAGGGDPGNPDWRTEFSTALGRWNSSSGFFSLTTDPGIGASTPGECDSNDPNSVFFDEDSCGSAFGGSTLARARTSFFSDGESIHSDIIFNTAFTWGAYNDSRNLHPGVIDFRRVAVHEVGHTMGLGHGYNSSTIMYFQSNDTIDPQIDDLDALKSRYGIMTFAESADVNGNTEQEIITIRSGDDLSINAELRDGSSGALLKNIPFLNSGFTPVDIVALPDLDSNGHLELGVLATRNSDGRAVVEIRNITGAAVPRVIWFAADAKPVKVVSVPDADANGVSEIAVLLVRVSDNSRSFVEVKNAFGPTAPNVLWSSRFNYALDMAVINDADSNGVPEIAVLLRRWQDGRGVVEIRNASGPTLPNAVWASAGVSVKAITTVDDADSNGIPEIATLSTRDIDGRILVEVKNASGATNPTALWYAVGHSARAVASINDADSNGIPEVAVLSRRQSDGRIVVETKNASGATAPQAMWYSPGYAPLPTLSILDDIDNNNIPEAAVMLYRNTDGRITIQQRNTSGPNAARNIWVSP